MYFNILSFYWYDDVKELSLMSFQRAEDCKTRNLFYLGHDTNGGWSFHLLFIKVLGGAW